MTDLRAVARAATAVGSGTVFVALASHARRGDVSPTEVRVFRALNTLPDALAPPLWIAMQAGSLAAVGVASAAAATTGRRSLAIQLGVAGAAVWGASKLAKRMIGRGRPSAHLEGVTVRGTAQTGLGYPSGHAAVSLTLAGLATPALSRPAATAAWTAVALVAVARQYVGAHLPVDVVGGIALGVAATAIAPAVVTGGSGQL